ncbi:MAG: hypothetical protein ABJF11_08695 [Reichenbachiella sp.]|uniref:hypothetical protein n=1 Tax=Reichenbachiella sp. TaxID=2184521 RepID=UPI0032636C4E
MLESTLRIILTALFIMGCSNIPDTQTPYSIVSKANCSGPSGEYHTELHATTDGYTRFIQSYPNDKERYDAISYGDTLGFTLNRDKVDRWTDIPEIAVGKGHMFHMIAIEPAFIFTLTADQRYLDSTGRIISIKNDSTGARIHSFELTNPFDSAELIEIYYSNWELVDGHELPMHVKIVQGGENEFYFDFYEVKIDDPTFTKVEPNQELSH